MLGIDPNNIGLKLQRSFAIIYVKRNAYPYIILFCLLEEIFSTVSTTVLSFLAWNTTVAL